MFRDALVNLKFEYLRIKRKIREMKEVLESQTERNELREY